MANLPTGTVTFLLTDVQGSTALWERDPEAMRQALARHDALMATVVSSHGGVVVKSRGEGDSVFAVFAHPSDARTVAAARTELGEEAFAAAWAEGRAMSMQQAIAYALDESSSA